MKKIISKILIGAMAVSMFSTTAFAYKLEVEDQLKISNVVSSDSRVFALDEEKNPIQTYLAEGIVNIQAVGENMEYFSVMQILPINGYWTAAVQVPFSYGGMTSETTVEPYSMVSITESGLYKVVSQKDGEMITNVIYVEEGTNYKSNAYLTELQTATVTVDGQEIEIDVYEVDDEVFFKIRDIAQMLVGTDEEFEVTWNETFELIDIYPGQEYTVTGREFITTAQEEAALIALDTAPDLFKEKSSTRVNGYVINDENFYNIEKFADMFDFYIDINLKKDYITIDTTSEYLPD